MKKELFKIIMQLHGEEGGAPASGGEPAATPAPAAAAPATTAATQATPAPETNTATQPESAANSPTPAAEPAKPSYKVVATAGNTQLVEDANGRKRIIDIPAAEPETTPTDVPQQQVQQPEPAATTPTATEPSQQTPPLVAPQPQQAPAPYTPDELSLAIQLGVVDESRIPANQMIAYGQYKERMAQQQAIANGQQQAQKEQKPDETQQRIKFMQDVEKTAHELTLKELGLTEDDIADAEYNSYSDNPDLKKRIESFNTLKEYNKQRIFSDVTQRQAQAEQQAAAQKAVYDDVNAFVSNEMKSEPKFAEINQALLTHYKTLPFEQAQRYFNAINALNAGNLTEAQAKDLQEYYSETKKAVYAKSNNLSTTPQPVVRKPAVVESPGTGLEIQRQSNPAELRGLNYRQKIDWIAKNL